MGDKNLGDGTGDSIGKGLRGHKEPIPPSVAAAAATANNKMASFRVNSTISTGGARRKNESTGQYFRRLDRLVAKAKVEASLETRFDMNLGDGPKRKFSGDKPEFKESRKRRRRRRY